MTGNNGFDQYEEADRESVDHDVDRLVLAYVDRLNAGEELNRQKIISEHPDIATELLEQLETFIGLVARVQFSYYAGVRVADKASS